MLTYKATYPAEKIISAHLAPVSGTMMRLIAEPNRIYAFVSPGLMPRRTAMSSAADKGRTIKAIPIRVDHLTQVRFKKPGSLVLTFADGVRQVLQTSKLGMPPSRFLWANASVSSDGKFMTVTGVKGDEVPIDSATLRYLVDEVYASRVDAELKALQFSSTELDDLSTDSMPPEDWYKQPARDLTRESWK